MQIACGYLLEFFISHLEPVDGEGVQLYEVFVDIVIRVYACNLLQI